MKNKLEISDFSLFQIAVRSISKISESAKFCINDSGFSVYGCRGKIARFELMSNAICSETPVEFCIADMKLFRSAISSIEESFGKKISNINFSFDPPFIRISSKKIKIKFITCNERVIEQWISKKITMALHPVFEFSIPSENISKVLSKTYICKDQSALRISLLTDEEMEKNKIYANIGNKNTDLSNEMTLELGNIDFMEREDNNPIILDQERMSLLNILGTKQISVSLMNVNVLKSEEKIIGKNDSFLSFAIYLSILKA